MSAVQLTPAQRNQREIKRLRKEAKADQARQKQQRKQFEQQRRAYEESINHLNQQRNSDRQEFQTSVNRLQGDLKASEERRRKELRNLDNKLSNQINNVQIQLSNEINDLRDFTTSNINTLYDIADQHTEQIENINNEIRDIHERDEKNAALARNRLAYINDYIRDLRNQFPDHDRLLPGALNKVIRESQGISGLIDNAEQAAIGECHRTINQLAEIEKQLIIESRKFDTLLASVTSELQRLKDTCVENSIDLYEKPFNVNDWSSEELKALEEEIDSLSQELEKNKDSMTYDELEKLNQNVVKKSKELETLYERTRLKIIAARDRILIGKQIREILKDNGHYQILGERGNEDDALWNSYWIKLKTSTNPGAGELDVIIEPDYSNPDNIQHKIILNSHDLDRIALTKRMDEIRKILSDNGIHCGSTDCLQDDHLKISEDQIKRVIQPGSKGLSDEIKKKLGV